MQKTTQVEDFEEDFDPSSEPLEGSGFEQEFTDPAFSGNDNEEAEN